MSKKIQTVRGMKDILPDIWPYYDFIFKEAENVLKNAGFSRISTPILEFSELFQRTVGDATDIIEKEMYVFQDKGGDEVCLKPEMTAPICRSYIQNGMETWPKPVKVFYIEPNFRYERPQKGRQRQFWQIGFEILGVQDPIVDAETINLALMLLSSWGIKEYLLKINSIGCLNCRKKYRKALVDYYNNHFDEICDDCKRRILKNPLRVLDCKNKKCSNIKREAPQILDYLCNDCSEHFKGVLEYLDDLNINYDLDPFLVRGLDYYTRTVFEIICLDDEDLALGSGGRYDDLIEMLGGEKTPGCGVAFGVERLINFLQEKKIPIKYEKPQGVFVVQIGDRARKKALLLVKMLREAGIFADCDLSNKSLKSQLKLVDKMGFPLALILGEKEVVEDAVILKDMSSGIQKTIKGGEIISEVQKRLPRQVT